MTEEAKVEEVKKDEVTATVENTAIAELQTEIALTGLKDSVANSDAMAIAKDAPVIARQDVLPSFFMDKEERNRVDVDILSGKETGRILSVSRKGIGVDFSEFSYLRYDEIWCDFTIPTYEEMTNYRSRSAVWRKEAQQLVIDRMQLRNFMLVWHLKDWSLTDKKGKKVELTFDKDGSLSEPSMKKVYSIHPTIMDVILTILEKDILLV